jgi:hypothetical protein
LNMTNSKAIVFHTRYDIHKYIGEHSMCSISRST